MIVLNIIPVGPDRTLETYDFFLETPEPNEAEIESIRYLDEVLQKEDIDIVESVQRGMMTPAFTQGRIVNDPEGSKIGTCRAPFPWVGSGQLCKGSHDTTQHRRFNGRSIGPAFPGAYGHKVAKPRILMRWPRAECALMRLL